MGRARAKCALAVVALVAIWALTVAGTVKPLAPKPTPPPQKTAQPTPPAPKVVLEDPATFTPDMTFGRAIEILRHCVNPPLNIVVLWRDVEERAGITRETLIGLDGVPGLRIRQYLDTLLRSVSAGANAELGFCLDGGVVLVATKDSLPKPKYEVRVYDVSDLLAPPSYGLMMLPLVSPFGNYGVGSSYNQYNQSANSTSSGGYQTSRRTQSGPGRPVLYGS